MSEIPTIQVEAKLTRHSKRADGGINIGLAVHPHGIPDQLRNAALGDRYLIVLVQLDDNEQPKEAAEEPAHQSPQARVASRMTIRAGMLCADPVFRKFLTEEYRHAIPKGNSVATEEDARIMVHFICDVKSRKEFIVGTPAGDRWDKLYSKFIGWHEGLA